MAIVTMALHVGRRAPLDFELSRIGVPDKRDMQLRLPRIRERSCRKAFMKSNIRAPGAATDAIFRVKFTTNLGGIV